MNISNLDEKERLGLVIASTPYRESDLILEVLFEEVGKHSVIARGARKSKRRFFGGIEIFEYGRFSLSKTKNRNILQLDGISERVFLEGLRKNLFSFQASSLLIEVASKLIPEEDPEAALLLPVLQKTLHHLSKNKDKPQCMAILCYGILEICKHSGIDPTSETTYFREDDTNWFKHMLTQKDIRTYDPPEAARRACQTLIQFIQSSMQLKIKSGVPS